MSSTIIKNVMRGHMSMTILSLLEANNSITTLEVKNELRNSHPEFSWMQKDVSSYMSDMHLSGDLTYEDNGTFRVYHGEEKKTVSKKKDPKTGKAMKKVKMTSISKSKAFDLIMGNKGYFFTAEFVKKDGEVRVMNCQALKDQDPKLGYIKVKEASLMRKDPKKAIRQLNMQTLKSLKIAGGAYKVK
jgi:hypothetical protein